MSGDPKTNNEFFNHAMGSDITASVGESYSTSVKHDSMEENMNNVVELNYDDIEVSGYYGPIDYKTGYPKNEYDEIVSYTLEVDADEVRLDLIDFIEEEHPEESHESIEEYVDKEFDNLVKKYNTKLKDNYRSWAEREAQEEYDPEEHYFSESVNIIEALNKIDSDTCNKYDLCNTYISKNLNEEKKKDFAKMIRDKVSPKKLYEYLDDDDDTSYETIRNRYYADTPTDSERFTFVKSKSVLDSDGFYTDYTWYKDNFTGNHVMVFGDNEIYLPEDEWFDAVFETEKEAQEWFDSYNGFEDELEESTVKTSKGKWVNRGKEGTHGTFATKKQADAQRKAMFANGYKENSKSSLAEAVEGVAEVNNLKDQKFEDDLKGTAPVSYADAVKRARNHKKESDAFELELQEKTAKTLDKEINNEEHKEPLDDMKIVLDESLFEERKTITIKKEVERKWYIANANDGRYISDVYGIIFDFDFDKAKSFDTRERAVSAIDSMKNSKEWKYFNPKPRFKIFHVDTDISSSEDTVNESLSEQTENIYKVTYKHSDNIYSAVMIKASSEQEAEDKFKERKPNREIAGVTRLSDGEAEDMKRRGMSLLESSSDGWSDEAEDSELFSRLEQLMYEVRNARKGVYTRCNTYEELAEYIRKLSEKMSDYADTLEDMEDEDLEESVKTNNGITEAAVKIDFYKYVPEGKAAEVYEEIKRLNKLDQLEDLVQELYPEGIDEMDLNDLLEYDTDWLFSTLGISNMFE